MALSKQDPRLAFYCEQRDAISSLLRRYVLLFFYEDRSVEMRELPKNVLHLKRTPFPHLKMNDFNIGAALTIFGGTVTLTAYADEVTRVLCEKRNEFTTVLLGELSFSQIGRSLAVLTEECGFTISSMHMAWVTPDTIAKYGLPQTFVGARVVVAWCNRADAVLKGLEYAERVSGAYAASDAEEAARWCQLTEEAERNPVVLFGEYHSSIVIVKPHAVQKQTAGNIIQRLLDTGLELSALVLTNLSSRVVDKFLQPYKGIFSDFSAMAKALAGPVWVAQFVSLDKSTDVVSVVREACGPFDPTIAKKLRPKSIRARFGLDRAQNAVHCCDLPGEGPIYADFFFGLKNLEE